VNSRSHPRRTSQFRRCEVRTVFRRDPRPFFSRATHSSKLRTLFQVPYPLSPLLATLTKTAGVYTNNSHSGTQRLRACHSLPAVRCQPHALSFHTLAHSFASLQNSTPSFSSDSTLFAKNHPGWGYPQLSPRLERNSLIANIDSSFGLPCRFLPQDTHPGSRVTPLPVAALSPECYDLVFHDPC
jgi:hypothetical protein